MSNRFKELAIEFIKRNDEADYDDFCEISDALYDEMRLDPSAWFEQVLPSVNATPIDYISRFLECVVEELDIGKYRSLLIKVFNDSNSEVKSVILDSLGLNSDLDSLNILRELVVTEQRHQISKVTFVVLLENELQSGQIKNYLVECYNCEKTPVELKDRIRQCVNRVYDLELSLDEAHKDWLKPKKQHHLDTAMSSAKEEFKKGRYKTVVKLLEQFDESELSEYGAKLLKLSRQKLYK